MVSLIKDSIFWFHIILKKRCKLLAGHKSVCTPVCDAGATTSARAPGAARRSTWRNPRKTRRCWWSPTRVRTCTARSRSSRAGSGCRLTCPALRRRRLRPRRRSSSRPGSPPPPPRPRQPRSQQATTGAAAGHRASKRRRAGATPRQREEGPRLLQARRRRPGRLRSDARVTLCRRSRAWCWPRTRATTARPPPCRRRGLLRRFLTVTRRLWWPGRALTSPSPGPLMKLLCFCRSR